MRIELPTERPVAFALAADGHGGMLVGGPFLDRGDPTEIRPGMVFTVEPGHSDTVAVTDDGLDFLTYYSRDLESLTLPGG